MSLHKFDSLIFVLDRMGNACRVILYIGNYVIVYYNSYCNIFGILGKEGFKHYY